DQPSVFQEELENVDVKMEDACESVEHDHVSNPANNIGRSRHNLTEAEKEARRIRRVLANRESARQTIRRRQAFHEELTRKAAELASENETLKRSKELAVKEFQSLQVANRDLKGQLSQTLDFKLGGENKGQAESSCTDSFHSANLQQLMYRRLSASPFVLPSCVRPSDLSMAQFSQQFYNPSCMLTEQENAMMNINTQKMPLCILPCPVFLSVPNINNNGDINQLSSLLLHDKDEASSVDSRHLYSPSSVIRCAHNCHVVLQPDEKMGCQSQTLFSFTLDGGGQSQQVVPREDCSCISPHASPASMNTVSVLSENRKQRSARKKESTVAGAEARKKRKELMKLKNRLHCQLLGLGQEDG
ncbi:Transcription factor HBP-1a, partial [Bienertia sinuspersici]